MINPSSFITFIFDKSIFLKTFYFTLVKNLDVFLFLISKYLIASIEQAVIAALFIVGLGIIVPALLLCFLIFALYIHVKLMLMLPYGIIGHCNLLKAYDMSNKSMAGKKIAAFFYIIALLILMVIPINLLRIGEVILLGLILLSPFIYYTTINLFYLKTTQASQQ